MMICQMRNKKIIEFQCRHRYKQLIKKAGVGEIIEFRYGSLDDHVDATMKRFGLRSSKPVSKLDYNASETVLEEWFYENAKSIVRNYNEFWIITSGDIAWMKVNLSEPVNDLYKFWLASSKDIGCVSGDLKHCFDFSTYEYEYEFHRAILKEETKG